MEQGTKEWLEWRRSGIGASDIPVIMGVSPWRTPLDLWEEKTGLKIPEQIPSYVQQKGHELEVIARNKYEIETGLVYEPCLFTHKKFKHFRASLDGYNEESGVVWECKYVGADDFRSIKNGFVPKKYKPQIQYQLAITEAQRAVLYGITDQHETAALTVKPDPDYQIMLLNAAHDFWDMVTTGKVPKLTDRDTVQLNKKELLDKAKKLEWLIVQKKNLEKDIYEIKKKIVEELPHSNCQIGNLKVKKVNRKGSIDYSQIDNLEGIDLEQFRKESSSHYIWSVRGNN